MKVADIVEQGLRVPRGSFKVAAALGELLAASSMFDLWMYQCLKGSLPTTDSELERAGRRSGEINVELGQAWAQFMDATATTPDHVDASAKLVPVLLAAARELRGFLGDLDFYDDAVLSPTLGEPEISQNQRN